MYSKYNVIFNKYYDYMKNNSKYSPDIVKFYSLSSTYFPTISFEDSNHTDTENRTIENIEYYDGYYFTINIYTKTKVINGENVQDKVIDDELDYLTRQFLKKLNIKVTLDKPTPNIDKSVLRRTIQCQCEIGNARGDIIRR